MEPHHYWIIVGICLLGAEIFTPGFLLASFGLGAFASSITAYLGYDFQSQMITFTVFTIIIFFAARPLYFKLFNRFDDQTPTGVNAFIGKSYKVTESVNSIENCGRVQIGSESWRVKTESDSTIAEGEIVTVLRIEGSTLIVKENKGE